MKVPKARLVLGVYLARLYRARLANMAHLIDKSDGILGAVTPPNTSPALRTFRAAL